MSPCQGCTRPHADQATICHDCAEALRGQLASVPSWAQRLETTRTRQAKTGGMNVGVVNRSEDRPLPWDQRASRSADRLRLEVVNAVRTLVTSHPGRLPENTMDEMARWLLSRLGQWKHHPEAVTMWESLSAALDDAERTVDRVPPRQFLGVCSVEHEGIACPGEVYARQGAHETDCQVCGVTHDVQYRRSSLLSAVEDHLFTASECSRAVSSLFRPVSPDLIRKWVERKRLTPHGINDQGRPTYRVSEVLDLMTEREAS